MFADLLQWLHRRPPEVYDQAFVTEVNVRRPHPRVLRLTLNRPEAHNALSESVRDGLRSGFDRFVADEGKLAGRPRRGEHVGRVVGDVEDAAPVAGETVAG